MLPKALACRGCDLEHQGTGFVPPHGPAKSRVAFIAEAPGRREAETHIPLVGDAGAKFGHVLYLLGKDRRDYRLHNCVACQPPRDWLAGAPWERGALAHCQVHLEPVLSEGHTVIVAMGAVAARWLTGVDAAIKDLHGTVHRDPLDRFWVVPTYHPSFLNRGGANLTKVVLWDIDRAFTIAEKGWDPQPYVIREDPSVDWFQEWVEEYEALLAAGDPWDHWLAVDIETPEKGDDEGELSIRDPTNTIVRVNFSYDTGEGVTVPFIGPYVPLIARLLQSPGPHVFWYRQYDCPRLEMNGCPVAPPILDAKDMCHVLQSDVPKGLGHWAPYYSDAPPWKHLSGVNPTYYAGMDGMQTIRIAYGAAADLVKTGLWDTYYHHYFRADELIYRPSEHVGVLIDKAKTVEMGKRLGDKQDELYRDIQKLVPDEVCRLVGAWKKDPGEEKTAGTRVKKPRPVIMKEEEQLVNVCVTCGATGVNKKHRCKNEKGKVDKDAKPNVQAQFKKVPRYYVRDDFNPGSPPQVLAYITHYKQKPGRDKHTGRPSANKQCIDRLAKHGHPMETRAFYRIILEYREVSKVKGTYVDGTLKRLEQDEAMGKTDGRICPTVTNRPSTGRVSYLNPNLQNVVADRGGKESLAAGYRDCIIAAPGYKLLGADYSGIEAVVTGYCAHDPNWIRLAKLGAHAYLGSHLLGDEGILKPGEVADLSWSNADLVEHFALVKSKFSVQYNKAKRCVHGVDYGLTDRGMVETYPELFPHLKDAQKVISLLHQLAPKIPEWQHQTRELAAKDHVLGGPGIHPYGYRHWFWEVYAYRRIPEATYLRMKAKGLSVTRMGEFFYKVAFGNDANRCVAFMPQSISAGKLKSDGLVLFDPEQPDNLATVRNGRHPLLAVIHDEFFLEVPDSKVEWVAERLEQVMTREITPGPDCSGMPLPEEWGMGKYLSIGISISVGQTWGSMEKLKTTGPEVESVVEGYDDSIEMGDTKWDAA